MKLIDEWKEAWKFFSVQANSIGAAIALTYVAMFDQLKEVMPPNIMIGLTGFVFLLGVIGRVIDQGKK